MSSIKERAEALRLAEKLRALPQAPGVAIKPAQSSSVWSSLIAHLRSKVTVKRRLVHLKPHDDCFLGAEAVDVLAEHVANAGSFEGAAVSRDKVARVCQALLDCDVFEAVGTKGFGKHKKRGAFEDSRSAVYRFVGEGSPSLEKLERGALAGGIQRWFCSSAPDRIEEKFAPDESQPDVSNPARETETNGNACQLAPRVHAKLPVEDPGREPAEAALSPSFVSDMWQEQILLRLLKLVELPLLEGVLQCSQDPPSHGHPDRISGSSLLDRQILRAFRDSQQDEWLCRALDCLDFLPDQQVVELSRGLPCFFPPSEEGAQRELPDGGAVRDGACSSDAGSDVVQWKLLLFWTLAKYYSSACRPPLLPPNMADVYVAVADLLVSAKLDKALEALQLCLKLLPADWREELCRLLTFMSAAADPDALRLDKEMGNRLAVKKWFSKAILHSKTFPKEKEDLMLVFMLSNVKEIFKTPGSLHKSISEKLAGFARGEQPDAAGSSLGLLPSGEVYADSARNNTNQELWVLLNNINLDTKMSARERKRLLRKFYLAHPEIFNQYFGDSAATEL